MRMNKLFEELKQDEGIKYEVYLDHLDHRTLGIGHLITLNDPEWDSPIGTPVSEERVRECFEKDVDISIQECNALYGSQFRSWPEEVQEIIVNMMFNLGRTRLGKFKNMRAALTELNWKQAAVEGRDSRWYRQVTNRAERLMRRLEEC